MPAPRAMLAAVVGLALALRLSVALAIPNFFGPVDPAVYFAMAKACLHEGVPRMHFIYHHLTRPPAIVHLEDYYEPAFAWLLALPMRLFGETRTAAQMVSVLAGALTVLLVHRVARRQGAGAALIAAAIVAVDPWSVYYGGLIMKEATVAAVAVAFLILARRVLVAPGHDAGRGAALAALALGAGLFQYELLPIVLVTTAVALARHRREALPAYLLAAALGLAALVALTMRWLGVPISAKVLFFLGHGFQSGVEEPGGATLARWLPWRTLGRGVLAGWNPVLAALAAIGLLRARDRVGVTLAITFSVAFLYVHAVPGDLWPRDFTTLTAVLAPYAGLALADRAWWCARMGGGLVAGPEGAPGPAMRSRLATAAPWVLAGALLALDWVLLPWPTIYGNPQFPRHEFWRAHHEEVCRALRLSVPVAPALASFPSEVWLYAGFPAVLIPPHADAATLEALRDRYAIRYLWLNPGAIEDTVLRALPVRRLRAFEDYQLYQFDPGRGPARSTRRARSHEAG